MLSPTSSRNSHSHPRLPAAGFIPPARPIGGMDLSGVILDVDGTVVRGDEPIPDARRGVAAVDEAGLARLFVSNNPTRAPPAYAERLRRAGVDADPSEILTSGTVTVAYLADEHPEATHHVVGEPGLVEQLAAEGLTVSDDPDAAEVCVVSIDREFTYDRLREALWLLRDESVAFVGTDPDVVIPAAEGDVPGSGAIINAVAGVVEREPNVVLGKPHPATAELALDRLGVPAEECLVVGDRLDTDVALGERAGMTTAVVLTGITDEARLAESAIQPDYVLGSLAELDDLLGG